MNQNPKSETNKRTTEKKKFIIRLGITGAILVFCIILMAIFEGTDFDVGVFLLIPVIIADVIVAGVFLFLYMRKNVKLINENMDNHMDFVKRQEAEKIYNLYKNLSTQN